MSLVAGGLALGALDAGHDDAEFRKAFAVPKDAAARVNKAATVYVPPVLKPVSEPSREKLSRKLCLLGVGPEDALARLSMSRGLAVPDTEEQRRWMLNFSGYGRARLR